VPEPIINAMAKTKKPIRSTRLGTAKARVLSYAFHHPGETSSQIARALNLTPAGVSHIFQNAKFNGYPGNTLIVRDARASKLDSKKARILRFAWHHPEMNSAQIAGALGEDASEISSGISQARRRGVPFKNPLQPGRGRVSADLIGRIEKALRETIKPGFMIARELGASSAFVAHINRAKGCRSKKVSSSLGHRTGINWKRLPEKNLFSEKQKWDIVQEYDNAIVGVNEVMRWAPSVDWNDLRQHARIELFNALDHYSPELCSERVFVLGALQRIFLKIARSEIKAQWRKRKVMLYFEELKPGHPVRKLVGYEDRDR